MKYKVGKSSIQGKGLIVKEPFKEGELIGLAHINNQPTKVVGLHHNHSDEPTAGNIEVGNKRYLVALRNLKPGEEITTNYREQPELEQPEDFEKKKGGTVSMPTDKPEKSKKFSRSLDATNRLFTENNLFKRPKSRKNKVFDPKAKYYQKGGEPGDRFKKRLIKKYPGMQGVYGSEGENLNIIKDPNYAASDYGFGNIEFIHPGSGHVQYSDDYDYQSPTPDKYTAVYNPKGANKHDVFLDTMHGMRNDPEYMKLLDKFSSETKKTRGESMDHWYEVDSKKDPYLVEDGREQWDKNFIDGVLRSHLAKKGMGRHSSDVKGYKMERQESTPEMYKATDDIYKYLKGKFKNGGAYYDDSRDAWVGADGTVGPNGPATYANGGESGCPDNMIWDEATQSCVSANETTTEEVGFDPIDMWAEDYEQKNPRGSYVYDKKQQYLKRHKGLNKAAGVTLDNFPKEVEDQINEKYNYNMNGYITDRMAKVKKFNPNKHDEWVDELGDRSKEVIANSKYGSKLQPSLWARSLAGGQELGNAAVKTLRGALTGETGKDVFNHKTPGLTQKEWNEIHNSSTGALETLSAADVPGVVVANYLKNSKKDNPNIFSGELMSNVDAVDAMAMNPMGVIGGIEGLAALGTKGISLLGLTADALKPGAKALSKFLGTDSGVLSNTYKLNPKALKEAQEAMLVRARPIGQDPYINMVESLRAKEAAGEPLKWYQKNLLNPQTNPDILAREKYYGQWFADNPSDLDFYINPATRNFADDAQIEILKARMPKSEAAKYNIKNFEDAKTLSNLQDSEYILPKNMVQQTERYSVDDLPRLIEEYNQINKPHWLKGYPEVPLELPSSPNVSAVTEPFEIAKKRIVNSSDNINRIIRKPEPIAKPNYGQQEFAFPTDAPIPSARLSNEEQMIEGMERARLAKNEEGTALNPSVSIDKPHKVNSPDYYLDIMKMNKYNGKNKQYFIDLVESVKKQGNVASERQYDELQRILSGDYSRSKKGYTEGGATLDLTEDEINAYKEGGWVVEYVD